jgi:Tfp pilus assembly protein PilV
MSVRRISRAQRRRLACNEDGLGMTEILVAMMVFAIIATTAAYGILNALTLTSSTRSSATAMSIASSDLDKMRIAASVDDSGVFDVVSTTSPILKTVAGTTYSVSRTVTWQTTTGTIGACGTGTGTLQYKNVSETVSWVTTNGRTRSVTMSSSIAPLSNINSDTTGTIIVTVTGAGGQPVPGLTVSITPTSTGGGSPLNTPPQNTDVAGCSFGLLVDPGSYNVTASLPGDIDVYQNAAAIITTVATTPTASPVSVAAGQNTIVNFTYDQAATFPLTYPAGATLPTNLPISFYHPTPGTTPFQSSTPPASVKAFPWSDGYTILGGKYAYTATTSPASCLDTNPATWTTPRAGDGALGVAPTPVIAGGGTTAAPTAVPLGTLTLSGIGSLSGKYITAVTKSTPAAGDPGCNAGQTLSFPVLGTVSSTTLALPYGTWNLYYGTSLGSTTNAFTSGLLTGQVGGTVVSGNAILIDPRVP